MVGDDLMAIMMGQRSHQHKHLLLLVWLCSCARCSSGWCYPPVAYNNIIQSRRVSAATAGTPSSRTASFFPSSSPNKLLPGRRIVQLAAAPEPPKQQQQEATTTTATASLLTEEQRDFCRGYLNKHHGDLLLRLVEVFTPLGAELMKANAWSGGSMTLTQATISQVVMTPSNNNSDSRLELQVVVQRPNQKTTTTSEQVTIPLNVAEPIPEKARQYPTLPIIPNNNNNNDRLPIDDWVRRMSRLCWIVQLPSVTGKLTQLALQVGGSKHHQLPPNLYLNQVPHNRFVRQYFYNAAAQAVLMAILDCSLQQQQQNQATLIAPASSSSSSSVPPTTTATSQHAVNRMLVTAQFPELNPSMDSYRIGTLLELVRAIAIKIVEDTNLRVRVCVQQSMGVGIFTGLPKQLGGVARLLQMMDWQSEAGEENEGMIGNYVNFGGIGANHVVNEVRDPATGDIVQHQDDVFLLVAPQSMIGTDSSILPLLQEMVQAAGDRPVILINPDLTDKMSSAGQQSVRGRQARLDFANSFRTIYCFQNIYISGTSYFPILGAVTKSSCHDPWIAHQRRDLVDDGGELYVPMLLSETRPDGETILNSFER